MAIKDVFIKQDNGEQKNVGHLYKTQFRKKIKGSKHIYKATNSIGIDAEVWNKVIVIEYETIVVLDVETNTYYSARVSVIDKLKDYKHFKPHRAQVMLPLKHFERLKRK